MRLAVLLLILAGANTMRADCVSGGARPSTGTPPGAKPMLGYQQPPAANAPVGSIFTYRPGAPAAICIPPGKSDVIFVGDLYPARIYKLNLDGKVLGMFGKAGKMPGQISGIHGLACPNENTIYTAEFINWRVQKFILHPEKMAK